jgi:hypothetical protein
VLDGDLAQDRVAVVRHHDPAHRVHQHLQHRARAQARADHVRDRLNRSNNMREEVINKTLAAVMFPACT